jgi:ATP-binding cassette, subfamily B (MDR/TAP), member 1
MSASSTKRKFHSLKQCFDSLFRRKTKALRNVNIKFERGKVTALVGPSGSGKSTIVQLIERFYDPQEGEILIDGVNFKDISLRDFRSKVGYVGQEPVLFNQTIRENLQYGNPDATEEDMMIALKKANAAKVIERLPEGLDTIVGAQGGQLSGGEKQRIALARAFVKNPSVLILDEATSALDRQNEKEVQEAIDKLENGDFNITTIVIAHRLSTIINSDKIVVLKEGQVVEEGDHKSLLKQHPNGVYSTLVRTQEKLEDDEDIEEESASDEEEGDSETNNHRRRSSKYRKKSLDHHKKSSFGEELKDKKEEADKMDADEEEIIKEINKNIKKRGFFRRLIGYNKPYFLIAVGLLSAGVQGMVFPVFAIFYVKSLFAIFDKDFDEIGFWTIIMIIIAICSFIATYLQKLSFGVLAESVTKEIRKDIYHSLLRKHVGWFDKKENNSGALTGVLTSDVYLLNGVSAESMSTLIETSIGMIGGIIIALIFEWKTTLCSFGVVPFFICSAMIQVKLQTGITEKQDGALRNANLLISDAISNYKTVASFGHEHILVDILREKLKTPVRQGSIKSHIAGIVFGYSNFVQNVGFAIVFMFGALFIRYTDSEPEDTFIAIYAIMFAAWGVGQAQQFAPSAGKAAKAAMRIFSIIDEPSNINIDETSPEHVVANEETFVGEIEFRNVWFRYPTRPDVWILKDFSLKIKPKEHIALVGESGSGKSTIVQLIYRFYEPHFGNIFIDGVDIKHYDLVSLRRQFGLVQQMPTLFDEPILYNICYGEEEQDLQKAIKAAEISNSAGFISKLDQAESDKIIEEHEEEDYYNEAELIKGMNTN